MSRERIYEYIQGGPRWGRLATDGRDGFPHVVPLSYYVLGEDLIISARGQRLANIRRDPKVCFTIDSGTDMSNLAGAVLQGSAQVVEDEAERLELSREGMRRRGTAEDQLPTELRPGQYYIKLRPEKTASWDYATR
ncbi:MAG: hypothetical protein GEU80_03890 [Dehalococcoidia bacterium]|nr:hypothetical protein [Dehalococcoidia bacterium]